MMTTPNSSALADIYGSDSVEQLLAEAEALLQSISEGSQTPPSSPSDTSQKPRRASSSSKTKRSRNSTRDRQQRELQFLRQHVYELEAEAAKLQLVRRGGGVDAVSPHQQQQPKASSVAWQQLAQRQKKARKLSEHANASLKRCVVERAQLVRSIRALLLAHQSSTSSWRHAHNSHLHNRMLLADWEEAAVFARLKQDAVRAHAAFDRVFADVGVGVDMDTTEGDVSSHTRDEQRQRVASRVVSTRVFPFDVHASSNAAWCAITSTLYTDATADGLSSGGSNGSVFLPSGFRVVERSDTIYAVSYIVMLSVGSTQLAVRVRDVAMRFPSESHGKSVFVWQTALDYDTKKSSRSSSADREPQIFGSWWMTFQQLPDSCSSSVLQSVFEFHAKLSPAGDDGSGDVEVMKTWVALGEGCVDSVALQVDKSLFVQ